MLTVPGVPEFITREQLAEWLAAIGVEARDLQTLTVGRGGITARVYARNEQGHRYCVGSEPAVHEVVIEVKDASRFVSHIPAEDGEAVEAPDVGVDYSTVV